MVTVACAFSKSISDLYFDDVLKYCTYKNEAQCGPVEVKKKVEDDPATRAPKCPRDPDVCQLANYCFCSRKGKIMSWLGDNWHNLCETFLTSMQEIWLPVQRGSLREGPRRDSTICRNSSS